MNCPKCNYSQPDDTPECISCGIVFSKFEAALRKKEKGNEVFSPDGGPPIEEGTDSAPPPPPPAEEPPTRPLGLDAAIDLRKRMERLQVGMLGLERFQEGLSREVSGQGNRLRDLQDAFGRLRGNVEEQLRDLETQLLGLSETWDESAETLARSIGELPLRSEIEGLRAELEKLPGLVDAIQRALPRLDQVEPLFAEVRRLADQMAQKETPSELGLLRSEMQALQAEVRNLLADQEESRKEEPMPESSGSDATGVDLTELKGRLESLEQEFEAASGKQNQEEADAKLRHGELESRLRLLEDRVEGLAPPVTTTTSGTPEELEHLRDGYRLFGEEIRRELAAQTQRADRAEEELRLLREEMDGIRNIFARLKSAL